MCNPKQWWLNRIRDETKEAELDEREARTKSAVKGLRHERKQNNFGKLFDIAIHPREATPDDH